MPNINFCTLFDSHYLLRGLALHESLKNCCPQFHLYILAMDDIVETFFREKHLPFVTVISLKEFETPELQIVKKDRTKGEYCWTCTPAIIDYCLTKYSLDSCTYLDADIFFFNSPEILLTEAKSKSVLITPHYYTPEYDQTSASGTYCVQFMYFKNDLYGREALTWWRERCIDWCYARYEDGKFGDQKYLDDWETRFENVHVLKNKAGALAPWNIQQFHVSAKDDTIHVESRIKKEINDSIVFYHFHNLKIYVDDSCDFGNYKIPKSARKNIYGSYIKSIEKQVLIAPNATDRLQAPRRDLKRLMSTIKRLYRGNYNLFAFQKLTGSP